MIESIVREVQTEDFARYEDVRLVAPNGDRRHVEIAANVYLLGGKKIIQCIVRDITDRIQVLQRERAARAEAEAANRAKDDFLSILSHGLRTPLTAMLGWARVLRRGALDASKTDDALETIERNTGLLAQLIEDLLDVSARSRRQAGHRGGTPRTGDRRPEPPSRQCGNRRSAKGLRVRWILRTVAASCGGTAIGSSRWCGTCYPQPSSSRPAVGASA